MSWCEVCCTQHAAVNDCPGELLATGVEQTGARLAVSGDSIREVYGVLIAQSAELWRGRLLTYPDRLWSVPGGIGTLKFVGSSPEEVEAKALSFVRDHCGRRGLRILGESAEADEALARTSVNRGERRAPEKRFPHTLPIRYGEAATDLDGRTDNLSKGGLFIASERLLAAGTPVKLLLQLDQYSIPITGRIAWRREAGSEGLPVGMGVELHNPPSMYARYVESVMSADAPGAERAAPG